MKSIKYQGLIGGIVFLIIMLALPVPSGMSVAARNAAAVALLMAIWWITEAIPIYATAFLPMVLFPVLKVLPAGETAVNYGHDLVQLMISGFFIAKAIENQNLHKRISLVLIKALGTSRQLILLSIMLATAFLSMWIANVTAALMMLPIGMAIISKEETLGNSNPKFGAALMLGIAFAASIGGVATLIGSPTNLIYVGIMDKLFPLAPKISFFDWLKVGIPIMIIFLPLIWYYLAFYFKIKGTIPGNRELINDELKAMGKMSPGEKRVMYIFIFTTLGWIFREGFTFDQTVIPGWSSLLGVSKYVQDSTVGMLGALLLFMLPSGQEKKRLLDWKSASSVPWGVGVIVGGGYALATGFKATGLADWIGLQLAFVSGFPTLIILIIVCGAVLLFTEMNSNTATANIFLPILASIAVAGSINPVILMLPATFAASFVFIMPAGTGPNTVIFASNKLTVADMAKSGIWLKLISMILLPVILYSLMIYVLGVDLALPVWAK
ncbi:MAG: DASS family sodium-coupled anion symporter [Porphyromonadaceae bacterium]|nr:MAG: DASS family sodium-coupled anion symporter [Porphyromonadaceae bacterium]